ncbi:MAG: S41 family peptidase, partial [Coprococcus sp.]
MIYKDMYLFIIEIVITIILYFLAGYAVKAISSKWKLLYLLPAIICMFFVAFSGVEISLAGIYIGVVVMLIGFFREDKGIRHAISIISILCMLLSVAVCILNPYYRAVTYVDDFKEAFDELKTHYVLSDYKDIDWDMLYEKYLPEFETAYREQNAAKNTVAWMKFTREFDDVHVSYMAEEKETNDAAYDLMYGNDYGLSLMKLSDGDVVAVNVEKDSVVYNAGIRNGTIITLWDKKTIDEVAADIDIGVMSFACKENEDFYSALLVAGIGDDDVEISFIDDSGRTCTVTALKLGTYTRRLKSTLSIIDKGAEISNLCWNDIDEHTLLLRLRQMEYDAETSQSGEFEIMKEEIKQAVDERRERGVTNLILDLRSNVGGSGDYVKAIAELFAPEGEHVYAYDGV